MGSLENEPQSAARNRGYNRPVFGLSHVFFDEEHDAINFLWKINAFSKILALREKNEKPTKIPIIMGISKNPMLHWKTLKTRFREGIIDHDQTPRARVRAKAILGK